MIPFLSKMSIDRPEIEDSVILKAMQNADSYMLSRGIVSAGDISNGTQSIEIKAKSSIYYHTFIELLGLRRSLDEINKHALSLKEKFHQTKLPASTTFHAPYSAREDIISQLTNESAQSGAPVSFHFMESKEENDLYKNKPSPFLDFYEKLGISKPQHTSDDKKMLDRFFSSLNKDAHYILVHNTFATPPLIRKIFHTLKHVSWCLCPRSNLYINNTIPNPALFPKDNISLGTDSLASNHSLSILDEMKTLQHFYPSLTFTDLITFATINGAKALKTEKFNGTLTPGKKPGLNIISNFDFRTMHLTPNSEIRLLVKP